MPSFKQYLRENHWFTPKPEDEYVYHGTPTSNLDKIRREGLKAFHYNWFATDPKVSMHYAYRGFMSKGKRPGTLLRVHKRHVNPEAYRRKGRREDFWTGPADIPPDRIEIRRQGRWEPLR